MAHIISLSDEAKAEWDAWVASKAEWPALVASATARPPDRLYRMKSTGQRVYVVSYFEDGTVRVAVDGRFNFVINERTVFGIRIDDLEECDLPGPDELVGCLVGQPGGALEELLPFAGQVIPNDDVPDGLRCTACDAEEG